MFLVEMLKDPLIEKRHKLLLISVITILVSLILTVISIIAELLLFGNIRDPISETEIILRFIFSIPFILSWFYFVVYLTYAFLMVIYSVCFMVFYLFLKKHKIEKRNSHN